MSYTCENNVFFYPALVDMIYSKSKVKTNINSNICMNFQISSNLPLPSNTKIQIIETNLKYKIYNTDKKILINGYNIKCNKCCTEENVWIDDRILNLVDTECKELNLNIVEEISASFDIQVDIKGIAYIDNYKDVYFEAFGNGEDRIKTILLTNISIPNTKKISSKVYLNFNNNIWGEANPNCLFLSPMYNYTTDIESLLGNVFLNYVISLSTYSLIPSRLNVLSIKK